MICAVFFAAAAEKTLLHEMDYSEPLEAAWIGTAIQGRIQNLMNHSPEEYTAENIDEICTDLDKLNDDIEPASRSLLAEIQNKQEELEAILERALEEDSVFHAIPAEIPPF